MRHVGAHSARMARPLPGEATGALSDLARSGQPRSTDETAIAVATLEPPPW